MSFAIPRVSLKQIRRTMIQGGFADARGTAAAGFDAHLGAWSDEEG
jgi:hypothetical protein